MLLVPGIAFFRGILPEVFESDGTRLDLRERNDHRRLIPRNQAGRDGGDGGHANREGIDARDMIQERGLPGAHPTEDRDLEGRGFQPADDHLECRPEFHKLPPRDDLLQIERSSRPRPGPPRGARGVLCKSRPMPLAEVGRNLVNQSRQILANLGDLRLMPPAPGSVAAECIDGRSSATVMPMKPMPQSSAQRRLVGRTSSGISHSLRWASIAVRIRAK